MAEYNWSSDLWFSIERILDLKIQIFRWWLRFAHDVLMGGSSLDLHLIFCSGTSLFLSRFLCWSFVVLVLFQYQGSRDFSLVSSSWWFGCMHFYLLCVLVLPGVVGASFPCNFLRRYIVPGVHGVSGLSSRNWRFGPFCLFRGSLSVKISVAQLPGLFGLLSSSWLTEWSLKQYIQVRLLP